MLLGAAPSIAPTLRSDGVLSYLSGMGTHRDKGESLQHVPDMPMLQQERDSLYEDNELLQKIIDTIVNDALRPGIDINHDRSDELDVLMRDLNWAYFFAEAGKFERLHDGAVLYMDIDDGRAPDQPLNWDNIKKVRSLEVFERWYVQADNVQRMLNSETFTMYKTDGSNLKVHTDRCIIFEGDTLSRDSRSKNNGWGGSVMKRIRRALLGYVNGNGAIVTIIQEFIIDLLKLEKLNEMSRNSGAYAQQDEAAFKAKMEFMLLAKSMINAVVLDSNEELEKRATPVTGLDQLVERLSKRLAAAADMPYGKLFGEYLGTGLGTASKTQSSDWDKRVDAYQNDKLKSRIGYFIEVLGASLKITDPISWDFRPQDTPSQKETAEMMLIMARVDAIYKALGMPAHVLFRNRLGGSEYSLTTAIDDDILAKIQELEELKAKLALMGANPVPVVKQVPAVSAGENADAAIPGQKFIFDYDPYAKGET